MVGVGARTEALAFEEGLPAAREGSQLSREVPDWPRRGRLRGV